jgi:hypothetical protein
MSIAELKLNSPTIKSKMAVTKSKLYGRCLNRKMIFFKITANVEAWRSAGHSIPSARLTAVDFYLQFKLRFFAQ